VRRSAVVVPSLNFVSNIRLNEANAEVRGAFQSTPPPNVIANAFSEMALFQTRARREQNLANGVMGLDGRRSWGEQIRDKFASTPLLLQ